MNDANSRNKLTRPLKSTQGFNSTTSLLIKDCRQQTIYSQLLLALFVFLLCFFYTKTISAKDLPGAATTSYGVSNGGAFNFSIPIVIPQGINGVQPNLSLNYSSAGGNGLLGMGWSLGGLGAITRCGKTFATNGIKGGVSHNADDRLCLNGQQLILVSGTYGANISEYRTEIDQIAKIQAISTTVNLNGGTAPSAINVFTKDGMKVNYGSGTSQIRLPGGTTSVHQWKVSAVIDPNLNEYRVDYHDDGRPDEIRYANNLFKVKFNYAIRPDTRSQYIAGIKLNYSHRLSSIVVTKGSTQIRKYNLNYEVASVSTRSRITSIVECGLNNIQCMPPIDVDWQTDEIGFDNGSGGNVAPSHTFTTNELTDNKEVTYGQWVDLNGDGEVDLIHAVRRPNGSIVNNAWIKNW